MRGPPQPLTVALVVLGAAAAGFFGYRAWQKRQLPGPRWLVTRADATATPPPAAIAPDPPTPELPPKPIVPDMVPEIELPDSNGKLKTLRSFRGSPVIINFWATWCAPCRREIPLLQQLRVTYQSEGLEIVGIAVDFQSAVADFLEHTPIAYPVLIGEDQGLAAAEKFGMDPVLPFSVFADGQGRIIAVKVGELHKDEADCILGAMRLVAAGKKSLPEARAGIAERLRALAVERAKAGSNNS
jgi:thiol-disulfide isomerase/thioredoxin